jgi:Gram-negative bacterial TonB protein C-terminal
MERFIYLVWGGLPAGQFLSASDAATQQAIRARLEQSIAKTNIFELPSFVMNANVEIENQGKLITGKYQLLWNGPDQWREAIRFPSYTELRVGGKGTIWTQRSTEFLLPRIENLRQALGFSSGAQSQGLGTWSLVQLALTPKDTIKKTHERKRHGIKVTCAEIESELGFTHEICVDKSTGTIDRGPSKEDREFLPAGEKVYPRSLSELESDKTVATVKITELVTPARFPSDAFKAPDGLSPQAGCMNPVPPRMIKRVNPEYAPRARDQHIQGGVSIDVLIATDGVPTIKAVVESPSPDLTTSSLNAVRGWRYDPATCNGQPVPIEALLQINYTVSF